MCHLQLLIYGVIVELEKGNIGMKKLGKIKGAGSEINTAALIKDLRDEEKRSEKANVTYRLTKIVVQTFKDVCEREDLVPGTVLEAFMRRFVESVRK